MKPKIFKSMTMLAIAAVLLTSILTTAVMYREFYSRIIREIRNEALYISTGYNTGGRDYLDKINNQPGTSRITWIAADGAVIFDNRANPKLMDNHLNRPEVASALINGWGEATHLSKTLGKETFYYAVLLEDGTIMRVSATTDSVFMSVFNFIPYMLLIIVFVFMPILIFVGYLTKRIVTPINHLNLEEPLQNDVYDELSPLLSRMQKQKMQIENQIIELKEKQDEFTAITKNMREGLILLNKKGRILSINKSALDIFNIKSFDNIYKHLLSLNRSPELHKAVNKALEGKAHTDTIVRGDNSFSILADPVFENGTVKGVMLLILDITESLKAEKIRREFSANVSHELKTPLTSISGYAEMLKNGMVKKDDIKLFAERIYVEATHLITLIDDIIQLSRLDERNISLPWENIDLLSLCNEIGRRLSNQADQKGISLNIKGQPAFIFGVRYIIDEMIYNLCDNAIKYNREGGFVDVSISKENDKAILTVSDNGIGIPKEHQPRIFERFYRVDKSHSRDTGGTGLGLSIVKHGVEFHNAAIELYSEPGTGTKVSIRFNIVPDDSLYIEE